MTHPRTTLVLVDHDGTRATVTRATRPYMHTNGQRFRMNRVCIQPVEKDPSTVTVSRPLLKQLLQRARIAGRVAA